MKAWNLVLFFLLAAFSLHGQNTFFNSYGTPGKEYNPVLKKCPGGNIIIGATVDSSSVRITKDIVLLKLNENGDTLWNRTYDSGNHEELVTVVPSHDNGFAVLALFYDSAFHRHISLIKTDSSGNLLWSKDFGGGYGNAWVMIQTMDSGYVIGGKSQIFDHGLILKVNSMGDTLWSRSVSSFYGHSVRDLVETDDSGIVAIVQLSQLDVTKFELMKFSQDGTFLFQKAFYGWDDDVDPGFRITKCQNRELVISFRTDLGVASNQNILARMDSAFNVLWWKEYSGLFYGTDILVSPDGSLFFCGAKSLTSAFLMKCDSSGTPLWTYQYDSLFLSGKDKMIILDDGSGILVGTVSDLTNSKNIGLIRTAPAGNIFCQSVPFLSIDLSVLLSVTTSNTVFDSGIQMYTSSYSTYSDTILTSVICAGNVDVNNLLAEYRPAIFPNPTANFISVNYSLQPLHDGTLEIFDRMGRLVFSEFLEKGSVSTRISTSDYSTGIYILRITSGDRIASAKFIKQQ